MEYYFSSKALLPKEKRDYMSHYRSGWMENLLFSTWINKSENDCMLLFRLSLSSTSSRGQAS